MARILPQNSFMISVNLSHKPPETYGFKPDNDLLEKLLTLNLELAEKEKQRFSTPSTERSPSSPHLSTSKLKIPTSDLKTPTSKPETSPSDLKALVSKLKVSTSKHYTSRPEPATPSTETRSPSTEPQSCDSALKTLFSRK
jgi:hypothetical protein